MKKLLFFLMFLSCSGFLSAQIRLPKNSLKKAKSQVDQNKARKAQKKKNNNKEQKQETPPPENKPQTQQAPAANNNTAAAPAAPEKPQTRFQVGDTVSVLLPMMSYWTYGVVTDVAGQDYEVQILSDIRSRSRSIGDLGKRKLVEKDLFTYWNYMDFFELTNKSARDSNKAMNQVKSMIGMTTKGNPKSVAPGESKFTPTAKNYSSLIMGINLIEDMLAKSPPLPEDIRKQMTKSLGVNPYHYILAIENKQDFLEVNFKKVIEDHLKFKVFNNTYPTSMSTQKGLKLENGQTAFWSTVLLCGHTTKFRELVEKDIDAYLKEIGLSKLKAASFLSDWDDRVAELRKKAEEKANAPKAWIKRYVHKDPAGEKACATKFMPSNAKMMRIAFSDTQYKITDSKTKDKSKRGAIFYKAPNCNYYVYIQFEYLMEHLGAGRYAPPKCIFAETGYTKEYK